MNLTDLLITATFVGPIAGALAATGLIGGILRLARARADRVDHVDANGTDLYLYGVPLTEKQLREAFGAMKDELDQLGAPAERTAWETAQGYQAINRFSVLAGTFPQAFPILSDADSAWQWYKENNGYVTRKAARRNGWPLLEQNAGL